MFYSNNVFMDFSLFCRRFWLRNETFWALLKDSDRESFPVFCYWWQFFLRFKLFFSITRGPNSFLKVWIESFLLAENFPVENLPLRSLSWNRNGTKIVKTFWVWLTSISQLKIFRYYKLDFFPQPSMSQSTTYQSKKTFGNERWLLIDFVPCVGFLMARKGQRAGVNFEIFPMKKLIFLLNCWLYFLSRCLSLTQSVFVGRYTNSKFIYVILALYYW